MRNFIFTSLAFLSGCAAESSDFPEMESAGLKVVTDYPYALNVMIEDGSEGTLQLIPYRMTEEGAEVGKPTSSMEITDDVMTIGVPAQPAGRDRDPSNRSAPVSYALVLFDAEFKITGIAPDRLIYSPKANNAEHIRRGWNILTNDTPDQSYIYKDISSPISIESNFLGEESISFVPMPEYPIVGETHLGVLSYVNETLSSLYDAPMIVNNSVNISDVPVTTAAFQDSQGVRYVDAQGIAYVDTNENNALDLGVDSLSAALCADGSPVHLVYTERVQSIAAALRMEEMGLRYGWSATTIENSKYVEVTDAFTENIPVSPECLPAD